MPSTSIFTVPSGSLIICSKVDNVPIFGRSSIVGSSDAGEFCAIKKIFLLLLKASSREKIDFSRPTNNVETVLGNITTCLKGIIGILIVNLRSSCSINWPLSY